MLKRPVYQRAGDARRGRLERPRAEEIGLAALLFLTEEPRRLGRFLGQSGLEPDQLRRQVNESQLQAAVLEYLLGDESLLLVFCADKRVPPDDVAPARVLLGGGEQADGGESTRSGRQP